MTDDYYNPEEESESESEPVSELATDNQLQQAPVTEVTSTEVSNSDIIQSAENPIGGGSADAEPPVVSEEQAEAHEEQVQNNEPQPQQTDPSLTTVDDEVASCQPREVPISVDAHPASDAVDETSAIPPRAPPLEYRPPAALATTPLASAAQASEVSEPLINLDADDQDDWEAGDFDFGDEPIDETWDTWGCLHHFELVQSSKMHENWLPATDNPQALRPTKHVDCLRCYRTITITDPIVEPVVEPIVEPVVKPKTDEERKDSAVDISEEAWIAAIDAVDEPEIKVKKKRKNKKQGDLSKLFNCRRCGVIYCVACKKATAKELNAILDRNTIQR